ncbi:hypothetical protein [Virgisporangium ochraceum]|uniref:Uncharacterized protein n=1 Tax=Virgisporangium ochraceum TaxID=65505 RepID=A0A8J4EJ26_9ACTN|nr:hypothetical protein [Virgisporangium ochraceum]GIJ73857.1 hypothetical protein Voc01_087740 [Virgisporangium ochraceum]
MLTDHVRDFAGTAAVFGFFAASWFGWAQESPPTRWKPLLLTGSVLSMLTAVAGGLLLWRLWSRGSAFDDTTAPRFGIVVGIEFGVAALGAVILAVRRRAELIPPWIALVVGVHLFPVAAILDYPLLHVVAAGVTIAALAALAAVPAARRRSIAVSATTGLPTGAVLLTGGLVSLAYAVMAL